MASLKPVFPVFLDTSVLIGGLIDIGSGGEAAQTILAAVAEGRIHRALTAWHCCLEFYSVTTRLPPEFRLSTRDALTLLEEEIFPRFKIHQLPEEDHRLLFEKAAREEIVGGRIYDTHIAAIALAAGARYVVTENPRHFTGLHADGIAVLTASDFVDARELR